MVGDGSKQRLLCGGATPQSEAMDAMMIEVDFAAYQTMRPVGAYGKALAEQVRVSGFTGVADDLQILDEVKEPTSARPVMTSGRYQPLGGARSAAATRSSTIVR